MKAPSAILVLANLMNSVGELNLESKSRVDTGITEHLKFPQIPLIVCGWNYRNDFPYSIASCMKHYILSTHKNIDKNLILMEENSRDTVGDAFFTKINFINRNSWDSVIVVTSDYHSPRTLEIFEFIYGEKVSVKIVCSITPVPLNTDHQRSEFLSTDSFRKTFKGVNSGDDLQIYRRLRLTHPFYNGKIHSKISLVQFNDDIKAS